MAFDTKMCEGLMKHPLQTRRHGLNRRGKPVYDVAICRCADRARGHRYDGLSKRKTAYPDPKTRRQHCQNPNSLAARHSYNCGSFLHDDMET